MSKNLYTFLLRDTRGKLWRSKGLGACAQEALDHIIDRCVAPDNTPVAWCLGTISNSMFGSFSQQDKRREKVADMIAQGRAIACFDLNDGTKRYIVQIPRDAAFERATTMIYNTRQEIDAWAVPKEEHAVKSADPEFKLDDFGERGVTSQEEADAITLAKHQANDTYEANLRLLQDKAMVGAVHMYMADMLGGKIDQPIKSNAKPAFAGLTRCSSDARERDHLVQARFGTVG